MDKSKKMKTVCIKWGALLSQEDAACSQRKGIYQFYGWHPAYSKDGVLVLLYIGVACKFKARLSTHEYLYNGGNTVVPSFFRPKKIMVRLGRITSNKDDVAIEKIEGMLISVHTPPWNSTNIRTVTVDKDAAVTIYNTGDRGDLLEKFVVRPSGFIKRVKIDGK